jgi:predicted exporter
MSLPRSTERPAPRAWAVLWALLALAAMLHAGWVLRGHGVVVDLFALLPEQGESAWQRAAVQRAADAGSAQVVVLLGSAEPGRLPAALQRLRASLAASTPKLVEQHPDPDALQAALATWTSRRNALLSAEQQRRLQHADPTALAQQALARLLQPLPSGLLPWVQDPLDLAAGWWQARNPLPMLQPVQGELRLQHAGLHWSLLRFQLQRPAFALDGERRLGSALDAAVASAREVGELTVLYAGVPLHADAAAAQAAREMSTIGLGSLLAVVLLVWLSFGSLRPILLVATSLLVGCAVGLSSTVLLFGEVHVLTLVFGASLVGVAEDYGIHYFAARQARPGVAPWTLLAALRPSLLLALITSVLAYLALGALPFPALRQMAWFSAAGLCAAFITVLLCFPWLDRAPPPATRFADGLRASLNHLPALSGARAWGLAVLLLVLSLWLLPGLRSADDLRQLQGSPPGLVAMQAEVGRLLQLSSPAQFFLVEADGEQALLQREEALIERLQPLRFAQRLAGWTALSDWVPSAARQAANRAMVAAAETLAFQQASQLLGETIGSAPPGADWTIDDFRASSLAALQPELQFGCEAGRCYSLVLLRGLPGPEAVPALAAAAEGLAGVRWVDRSADYSRLLQTYRQRMSVLLLLGFLAVAAVLHVRYGRVAWRAWLPTLLAMVSSLAALSLLAMPVTLFTVLALLLLLGIGIDYGIFLLDHGDGAAWMAVVLGASSTLLAFGLLGLSATPALQTFGLTLLSGIASVCLLTPLYRPPTGGTPACTH